MTMEQGKLTVATKGDYKNIKLSEKKKVELEGEMVETNKFLLDGKYVDIEKMFDNALEKTGQYGAYWICRVKYEGEEVSFFLNKQPEADAFNQLGDIGDKVRISGKAEVSSTGRDFLKLKFELL